MVFFRRMAALAATTEAAAGSPPYRATVTLAQRISPPGRCRVPVESGEAWMRRRAPASSCRGRPAGIARRWMICVGLLPTSPTGPASSSSRSAYWRPRKTRSSRPGSVRQLVHLTTAALVVTAFAVPAASGRAALALPVFRALAEALADRKRLVVMLALLFPTAIRLSSAATLIGAGTHLITVSVVRETTGDRIGFTEWLLLGRPLAVASSRLAAETVLLTTTRRTDRAAPVRITAEEVQRHSERPVTGPWTQAEKHCALLLATVVALWCSGFPAPCVARGGGSDRGGRRLVPRACATRAPRPRTVSAS